MVGRPKGPPTSEVTLTRTGSGSRQKPVVEVGSGESLDSCEKNVEKYLQEMLEQKFLITFHVIPNEIGKYVLAQTYLGRWEIHEPTPTANNAQSFKFCCCGPSAYKAFCRMKCELRWSLTLLACPLKQ
jgi:hypothetical protein